MTKLKLYTVTREYTVVVLAKDYAEAEEVSREAERDGDPDVSARELTYLPGGFTGDDRPYCNYDDEEVAAAEDWTINQWIEAGAAETYRKQREASRARIDKARATHVAPAADTSCEVIK